MSRSERIFPLGSQRILARLGARRPAGVSDSEEMMPGMRRPVCRIDVIQSRLLDEAREHGLLMQWWRSMSSRAAALPRQAKIRVLAACLAVAVLAAIPGTGVLARDSRPEGMGVKIRSGYLDAVTEYVSQRAAVALTDDFRSGLSNWEGSGDWGDTWSYDGAGFVRPGSIAILTPSKELTDYKMELLGQIEKRSLGWVVRARDDKNHYALRLLVTEPGPVPIVVVQRYPVIEGKAGPVSTKRLRMELRNDTVYRVQTEVRGNDFWVGVQDQVVDSWTEERLPFGGIGLFGGKGDQARVRWIGLWHQYDTIGRMCAFLAPPALHPGERED
jgi:hypothetical protein